MTTLTTRQWAKSPFGSKVLEPSAGFGSILRYFEQARSTFIEPNLKLAAIASLFAEKADYVEGGFERYGTRNKFDTIVMNPPRKSDMIANANAEAEHIIKAMHHLHDGGRIVALVKDDKETFDTIENYINGNVEGDEFEHMRIGGWLKPDEGRYNYITRRIKVPSAVWGRGSNKGNGVILIIDRHRSAKRLEGVHTKDYMGIGTFNAGHFGIEKYDENLTAFKENMTTEEFFDILEYTYDDLIPERLPVDDAVSKGIKQIDKWFNEQIYPFLPEIKDRPNWDYGWDWNKDSKATLNHIGEIVSAIMDRSLAKPEYEDATASVVGDFVYWADLGLTKRVTTSYTTGKNKNSFLKVIFKET